MKTRTIQLLAAAAIFALAGCSDTSEGDEGWSVDRTTEPSPELTQLDPAWEVAQHDEPFIVHEWGTYTSVQSAHGVQLEGLHHEEEDLPPFVYNLAEQNTGFLDITKGILSLPEPVTQKLETPVIYFYGDPESVEVDVAFPKGFITEWYPQNTTYAPTDRAYEFRDGYMSWDVELSDAAEVVEVPDEDIWAPSREVPDAKFVTSGDESDKFIFYRGMGRFRVPFRTTMSERGEYTVRNESGQEVPRVFVLEVKEDTGHIYDIGELEGFSEKQFMPAPKEMPKPIDVMVDEAKTKVSGALVETGLTRAEAEAMVNTWERSYFTKPGHRILYIAPRAWTDELLPIEITPQPDELVRTLVGRVDIVTHTEVESLSRRIVETQQAKDMSTFYEDSDRFLEPRIRATCEQMRHEGADFEALQWCQTVADKLTLHLPSLRE